MKQTPAVRVVVAFIFTLAAHSGPAQTADTANMRGHVEDKQHLDVVNAQITINNPTHGITRKSRSGPDGTFSVTGLPITGRYQVTVRSDGFAPAIVKDIALTASSTAEVRVELAPEGGRTVVNVIGTDGMRSDQPQLGTEFSASQIASIPAPGHRITYLPLLNAANRPAINQGDIFMNQFLFTTNGAGRRQTYFVVDGANAVDSWGRQTVFSTLPQTAVEQVTVLTNSFSAQYGFGAGSLVNIVTASGAQQLHGNLIGLWRPSATEASLSGFTATNAPSGNALTSDVLRQVGASLSGAVGPNGRTYFLSSFEHSRQAKDSPVTSPLAPGIFTGLYRGWLGVARLDRQIGERNNAFLRTNVDLQSDTNPNGIVGGASLPSVGRVFRRRTHSAVLGNTTILSPHLLNNVRLQFQLASPITQFSPTVFGTQYVVPITSGGTFTSGTSQSALLMNRQYEMSESLSWDRGRHQVTVGGDIVYAHSGGDSKEFGGPIFLGRLTYNTCSQAAAVCQSAAYLNDIHNVANYQQSFGNAAYTVDDQIWAGFAQDDFRVSSRLLLNAGIRYERQTFTDANRNFAPRVGFVADVDGSGGLILRAGYGIYYSQIVDNAAANYTLGEPNGVFTYTAAPGQVGFPSSVTAVPLPVFPAGGVVPTRSLYVRPGQSAYLARYLPTSILKGYPDKLLSPYSQQWTGSLAQRLPAGWVLNVDYVGTHTVRINRPLDIDGPDVFIRTTQNQSRTAQAANCTRPYWVYWFAQKGLTCSTSSSSPQAPYSVIQTDVANGYLHYNALDVNLNHSFASKFQMNVSYTWSHTLDNVDPDATSQNPNDTNLVGRVEYGSAIYDQRHRAVVHGEYQAPWGIRAGGVMTLASGLPYNLVTGTTNSGNTGATTDRPVINGVVVSRNSGRGRSFYMLDPFLSRRTALFGDRAYLELRAEAFNLFNHANFVGYNGTYGNGPTSPPTLGAPLPGVNSQLPAWQMQFSAKISF